MRQNFRWIGLTGGIASGKSTVSQLFESRGIPVVDADKIAKDVIGRGSLGLQKVVQAFGPEILCDNGELDRKKIAALVFSKKEQLSRLEAIVHPLVQEEVQTLREHYKSQGHHLVIYDVPLLFEKKLESQFQGIVLVWCDPLVQLERLRRRDGLSEDEAKIRLAAQIPLNDKKAKATWLIENNGDRNNLEKNFENVLMSLQS